jgi:hypothetical protein
MNSTDTGFEARDWNHDGECAECGQPVNLADCTMVMRQRHGLRYPVFICPSCDSEQFPSDPTDDADLALDIARDGASW